MKRISKEEKDKITRWEDIPLSNSELKRQNVVDENKTVSINTWIDVIKGTELERLRKVINTGAKIFMELDYDNYDGNLVNVTFSTDVDKAMNLYREETDEEYNRRIESYKKREWEELERTRSRNSNIERNEKALYEKLKKKYG